MYIEPLNHYDALNYLLLSSLLLSSLLQISLLQTSAQAKTLFEYTEKDNLKLMFDGYHLQTIQGDISRCLAD